jgi:hypothetical protein
MGLTERHWFEDEEPELTERQLEDIVYENKKAYDNGYAKGFHDALKEHPQIVRCKDCKNMKMMTRDIHGHIPIYCTNLGIYSEGLDWFCADGKIGDWNDRQTEN